MTGCVEASKGTAQEARSGPEWHQQRVCLGQTTWHCHILPGLDDGSPDMATSIVMARLAAAAGIDTVIGTPHWIEDEHETDPAQVRQIAKDLQAELNSRAIPLAVLPGNEAFICPDLPDRVKKGDALTLADKGMHLLLELPYEDLPTYVDDVIFRLQLQGITPVLAYVEGYTYVRGDWHVLDRIRGDDLAQDLMDRGLIACTATDTHGATQRELRSVWNEWSVSLMKEGLL